MKRILLGLGTIAGITIPVASVIACGGPVERTEYNWDQFVSYVCNPAISGWDTLVHDPAGTKPHSIKGNAISMWLGLNTTKHYSSNYKFYILDINGQAKEELINHLKANPLKDYNSNWFITWRNKYFLAEEEAKKNKPKTFGTYDFFRFDNVVLRLERVEDFLRFKGWL